MATLYHLGKSLKLVPTFYAITEEKMDELGLEWYSDVTQLERNTGSLLFLLLRG